MSIVPLAKVTIFGFAHEQSSVLETLQRLGCLHLIPLQAPPSSSEFGTTTVATQAREALRYLMDVPQRRHQVKVDAEFTLQAVISQALANKQQRRETEDRILALQKRLEERQAWGEFDFPALEDLGQIRLWFYRVPHPKLKAFRSGLADLDLPWQELYESARNAYFVILSPEEPDAAQLPVQRSQIGAESPQTLRDRLQQLRITLDDIEADHRSLSRWVFLLSKHLAQADDAAALEVAATKTKQEDTVLQVQGWIPRRDLPRLEIFTQAQGLAFIAETPQPGDTPPTLMHNPSPLSGGQDLVSFYQIPSYRDWDPSPVVFFSFALFFSMILADAGYALVLAVFLAIFWRKMGKRAGTRHFRVLAAVGLALAVLYGMVAGSYFGVEPSASSLLGHLKLLNLNDFEFMMKLSIAVGGLHLILANAVVAARATSLSETARPLGWIAVLIGGISMYLLAGQPWSFHLGVGLISGGLLTVLLLSSDRRLDSPRAFALRLLDGLGSLANISKLFGDVMSYLRLFALGLASASLALTFNQLARQVYDFDSILGVPIALLILLFGHAINLLLAIISGFVHGLRLNFIEFFNWSLSEEGYPFEPFIKKEPAS